MTERWLNLTHPDHYADVHRAAIGGCMETGTTRPPGFGWFYADDKDRLRPSTCTADVAVQAWGER